MKKQSFSQQNITQAMDHLAAQHIADDIDLAPAIQKQLRQQEKPARRSRIISLPYPLRFVAGLIICLVAATTVYAVVQLRGQPLGLEDEMVTPINISQTVGDMTFTVDWAYADANRVVLGTSLTGDGGNNVANNWLTDAVLTGTEGGRYYPIAAFGLDRSMPEMLSSDAHFNGAIIENGTGDDAPEVINLHLKAKNTFNIDFSVPFTPGVRVEDGTPVEVNGIAAWIDWAVITPSMARVNFCYEMPEDGPWYPNVQLAYDGERVAWEAGASYFQSPWEQRNSDDIWCRQDDFLTTYRELPETLTLKITHMQTPTYYSQENMERMAEIYAKYDIEAEVVKNTAIPHESYLLTFPDLRDDIDPDCWEEISEEARLNAGDPLEGERIDGPWVLSIDVPDAP
jgi:hypothetical protein